MLLQNVKRRHTFGNQIPAPPNVRSNTGRHLPFRSAVVSFREQVQCFSMKCEKRMLISHITPRLRELPRNIP
eukprot:3407660-Rhodomonas_salina.3